MDVGFAYDGDADRCLCVDEKGEVVDGDKIMYIYARYLKEHGELVNNTVVATVMSNCGLFKALDEIGIEYAKTAVGDKNVYDYMAAHNNCIGGEQSGHIIFSQYASTGDGILTSLKMMEVMLAKKTTLSKLAEPVTIFPQELVNVRVREEDKKKVIEDPRVLEACALAEKSLGGVGRMLLRKS
jgi:phosphoglucosamine mutase